MPVRSSPEAAARPARAIPTALAGAALGTLAIVAYHNSLWGAFVLDDLATVLDNASIRALWPPGRLLAPPESAGVGGRPLANVTFALNHAVSGTGPWSYHAFNLLLHVIAALLLFAVVGRTLAQPAIATRYRSAAGPLALIAAALWTVHPLQTAAVDYVSQRTEVLMAVCYLATLYCVIRAADGGRNHGWSILAVITCAAGMAAKEVMVTAPVLVLLHDRTFLASTWRGALRERRWLYAGLAATWTILGLLLWSSHVPERGVGFGLGVGMLDYVRAQCVAVTRYLTLAVWPHPLVFDHGWAYPRDWSSVAPQAVVCLGLVGATMWAAWRCPRIGYLGCAALLLLAPTSSIVPVIQQPIAESRMYLPTAAVVTGAVLAVAALPVRQAGIAAAAAIVAFTGMTLRRNADYATPVRLWSDTIAKRPDNARAHGNLGAVLLAGGDLAGATVALRRAVELWPFYPEAQNNLGVALLRAGRPADALPCFEAALAARPAFADAHYNIAEALGALGRQPEMIQHLEQTIELEPRHARAHNNLSVALLAVGRVPAAIAAAEAALRLQPGMAEAHYNLGNALTHAGRIAEAAAQYEVALRRNPKFARAANNLGVLALQSGDRERAARHFEAALQIDPDYAEARGHLERLRGSR